MKKKNKCFNCNNLCNEYFETKKETYLKGCLIIIDYYCAKCGRLIYEDIE